MENPAQVPRSIRRDKSKIPVVTFKSPSKIQVAKVVLKLLPFIINFRKDRREWVKREGKNINEKKYRKHAQNALRTFIELGPSYIKLGQWLSTRADIMPQPYLEVLATLQDDVPPAPFSKTRPVIEDELGKIESIFGTFDTKAFSGASLGQVYRATYNGQQVIVKVSRPEIEKIIEKDIAILKSILPLATRFIDPNLRFSAEAMLSQFIETVYEEMDYNKEADNLIAIKQNLKGESIVIPNVILELTSKHVITLEYIQGIKITDISSLDKAGIDRQKLVIRVHHIFFKMLLQHSIFHADPHPGNISVTNGGEIILYDFGMVGRLENETRLKLIRLYLSLVEKDPSRAVNVLIELGTLEPTVNRYIVEKALELSIQSLHGKEVDRMEVRALMDLTNKTLSRFPFRLPKNLALYMRMASIVEGIYQYHNVKFRFVKVLSQLLEQEGLIREAYIEEVKDSMKRFAKGIEQSVELAPLLKSYLDAQQIYGNRRQTSYNFLAASVFASTLFLGSALVLPHNPDIAYGGFIASAGAFAISLVAIVKKRF
ncbi:MAG: AarF/ABC1/UbiB kinase family protein [Candidatus Nitrosopolaris sp.]|jgi:predicted unusual protein kinase regulating ubiquinone biosynthesis (AarF/ABC1/UbiB family)